MRAAQALREDVKAEREAFLAWLAQVDPTRLVMVDESGICIGMRLGYGYAPRGQRAVDTAPAGRGRRLSLIGWLDWFGNGTVVHLSGTVNKAIFRRFVVEHLLEELEAGDIVVWDNAKIHEDAELVALIEAKGAELKRLPRYSPEFNAIEMLWSKLKHYIKKARADTQEALKGALEQAARLVQRSDAQGWFEHCGYRLQPT